MLLLNIIESSIVWGGGGGGGSRMGLLNRNFTRDWQHLRESGSGYDLSRATGGESAIRCWRLKCCPIDLRQTWFRSSTIIQQIELYVALCGTTFPENFTTAVCCQRALPNLRLKSFLYSAQPASFACLRVAPVCNMITKNLYSVVRHCGATNKTRTNIFVILAAPIKMSHWRQPTACTGHAFYHVTINGHA